MFDQAETMKIFLCHLLVANATGAPPFWLKMVYHFVLLTFLYLQIMLDVNLSISYVYLGIQNAVLVPWC